MIKRSLFSFWPTLFQYEVILESPASGIFYVGYQRVRDIGRELWLSMDDLTRHIMFFATTGGGKTETIFAWAINPLCWARGFTLVDGKAQNDTARTIWYLARRFGREDDVEVINFMNGGKSRSEIILSGEKRVLSQIPGIPSVTALRHSQRRQCSQCCPRTSRGRVAVPGHCHE